MRQIQLLGVIKMHKLSLVGEHVTIANNDYFITTSNNQIIDLNGQMTLLYYDNKNHNVTFNLQDQAHISLNIVKIVTSNLTINININNNSFLNLELLAINQGENNVNINIATLGNNNNVKIKAHVINKDSLSKIDFRCEGTMAKNTQDNILVEDLKGLIINQDSIKISPIIIVDANVSANHLVTISSFNKEDLFYLTTKGISLNLAKRMLIDSFINSIANSYYEDLLKSEVINIE